MSEFFSNGQAHGGPSGSPEMRNDEAERTEETLPEQSVNSTSDPLSVKCRLGIIGQALEDLQPSNLESAIALESLGRDDVFKIDTSGGEAGKRFLTGLRYFLKQIANIRNVVMVQRSVHPTLHDFLSAVALLPEIFGVRSHPLAWLRDRMLNGILGNFDVTLRREQKTESASRKKFCIVKSFCILKQLIFFRPRGRLISIIILHTNQNYV